MATATQQEREAMLARVHAALERTHGHRPHAALALGISNKQLHDVIRGNAALWTRWGKGEGEPIVEPDQTASELHREPPPEGVVSAIEKQDAVLARGWEVLGIDSKQKAFLEQLQLQYAANTRATMDLAYGGAAHANVKLLFTLESLYATLAEIDAVPDKFTKTAISEGGREYVTKTSDEFRLEVIDRIMRATDTLRKLSATVENANKVRLQMKQLEANMAKKSGPRKVAGWGEDEETPV